MIFWIAVAVATAVVAVILILPLSRGGAAAARAGEGADREKEMAVYRDQLKEVERDQAQGLISAGEADYARAEIGRRLLAVSAEEEAGAADATPARRPLRRWLAEMAVILLLPGIGVPLYLLVGAPGIPAQPLEERLANPGNNIELLLAKVERHLLQEPDDGAGWDLVAPIYARNQIFDKAVDAYRNAVRLLGESPERSGNFAEALIALGGGKVSDEAVGQLRAVLASDPKNPRARFYLALRLEQQGKRAEAFRAFGEIRKDAPAGANYVELVEQHMAATDPARPAALASAPALKGEGAQSPDAAAPGNPDADAMAAAAGMDSAERQQMILGMVETLDARLENEPGNFDGWLRLVRSYGVLGMKDKAGEALKRALDNFPADTDKGKQLVELGAAMGVAAAGSGQ